MNVGRAYQKGRKGQQAGRQVSAIIQLSRDGRGGRQAGRAEQRGMEAGQVRQACRQVSRKDWAQKGGMQSSGD
jgi:hypothetical protein